ncbi:hypothetical protein SLEP1_g35003 [Rubroshorea leprosula]|uniref:Longin domain-containing protein n=1 Tax=Rubroshorea leprosula TaxID=152421 RepID=A0AAV5KLW8_9ROSI|nr:hypothetical protein SLEP1_g35003 [Rubroshorea leprosula]
MISNPNLIFYACVAKGPIVLAEFSPKEPGIESLAQRCIEKTPPNHSLFSHTASGRTYTFLIDDPFAYFAIYDETLHKSESVWFLKRLRCVLEELLETGLIADGDDLTSNCFQSQFNPVFCEMMALDLESVTCPGSESRGSRNPSIGSSKGKNGVAPPLGNGNPVKGLKKKRRLSAEANSDWKDGGVENKMDVSDDGNGVCRDFPAPVCMPKGGNFFTGDRQKAKQIWRKHVLVVLFLDLVVCAALFGIWLYVCRGFQCIDADG